MFLLLSVLCLVIGYVYTRVNRIRRFADKIPGDAPWPILGNVHEVGADPLEFLPWLYKKWLKFGRDINGVWFGMDYIVIITEPKDVEVILSSPIHLSKTEDYKFYEPWLGKGLLTASGNQWRNSRKIITPTFHFKILEQYAEVFNRASDVLVEKLKDHADGKVIDIGQFVTLCALDVITESAMGIKINAQDDSDSEIVRSILDICKIMTARSFSAWQRINFIYRLSNIYKRQEEVLKTIFSFNEKIITERANVLRNKNNIPEEEEIDDDGIVMNKKKKVAFLDMLLTTTVDGKNLPDQMIRDEVTTFIFEGHDTTTAALSFSMSAFANNPDAQKKAFEEQRKIFGTDKSRHATYQDFQNMKYLERFIKEVLRIYPSVPLFGRKLSEDVEMNGKILPANCNVVIFVYAMNRNPKYFPDPEKFDPDRFLPENRLNKHPYEYVSFSAGPRNCIGQKFAMLEIKSVLSKVLRNYEVLSAGPGSEPITYFDLTLKSQNGSQVRLKPRGY